MNVYAVMQCMAYEGEQLMGIFSTEQLARTKAEELKDPDYDQTSLWYEIRKVELDKNYVENFESVGEEI